MIANFISFIRIILAGTLFFLNAKQKLIVIFVAAITDFLDGYIARWVRQSQGSGMWIDPLADKIFITCLYVSLVLEHQVPQWVFVLFVGRDVLISAGYLFMKYKKMFGNFTPSFVSKVNTCLQMLYPMAVISSTYPELFMYLTVTTTILSAIVYLFRFLLSYWLSKATRIPTYG
ncbi:MAG: CDP-alcohol phosphatidyltransferase family protein [Alphaproteobacteria bacterium]|nr:MAG: CDP-alcohol phosphatidyltransferase family protein [Alphaproteobacteria bacterium]